MGVGSGSGENKLQDAVTSAVNSPLLETKISGARAVLINITGGSNLTMFDVDKVATQIEEEADNNAIIILGASIKEEMQDEIGITVIAAGFERTPSGPSKSSIDDRLIPPVRERETVETEQGTYTRDTGSIPAADRPSWLDPKPAEEDDSVRSSGIDIPGFLKR